MGRYVTVVRNNIDGLHIKKVGTFHEGALWSIDNVPKEVIMKTMNKETAKNKIGKIVDLCTFLGPDGSTIDLDDAFIPRFKIGKAPTAPDTYESSKKSRKVEVSPEDNNKDTDVEIDSEETESEEVTDDESSETEVSEENINESKPKKKKLGKKSKE